MARLTGTISAWGEAMRVAAAADAVELARVDVVVSLALRWGRVVVARSSSERDRVAASRELRALLGTRRPAGTGGVGDDGDLVGPEPVGGVGDQLAALYGPPVAG